MEGLLGGAEAAAVALPLSLFLQLRHFHCIRHANGADIHFGKRNIELWVTLYPHSRSLSLSVCPLEIPSLGRADCAHLQSEIWGGICTTWKKRKRERRKDSSVCPLLPRHLDLVPLSFTFTFIVSSRAKGTTEVASKMLSKFSWFRHDE